MRTVVAQRLHGSPFELTDDNPVGQARGLLIVESDSLEAVERHVESSEIFPDTIVTISKLLTLAQSDSASKDRLGFLRRVVPTDSP